MYRQSLPLYSLIRNRIAAFKTPYIALLRLVPRTASWQDTAIENSRHNRYLSNSIRHWNRAGDSSNNDKSSKIIKQPNPASPVPKEPLEGVGQKSREKAADLNSQPKQSAKPIQNEVSSSETSTSDEKVLKSGDSKAKNSREVDTAETTEEEDDGYLTTIFDGMEPYLDTYEVYIQLVNAGFTEKQANSIMNLIIIQINTKVSKLSTKYAQVYELENERYLFESAQQELRVDSTRSREQHINELIALTHILERDFLVISDELNNEVLQMKNDTQVAINDQKLENTLHSKQIYLRIQETNHKISTELISLMRSEIETLRWNISRWGIMAILACVFVGFVTFYVYKAKSSRRQRAEGSEFVPLVIHEPSELEEDDYHTDLDRSEIA